MSWINDFSFKTKHKGKKIVTVIGSKEFDDYYKNVGKKGSNKVIKVPAGYEGRLDLLSLEVYGTPSKWWQLAIANNIFDPVEQIHAGMLLKVPF
jgi:hypothetical protein